MNEIICADCLDILKSMPDKSVDLVLTDPPYGIGEAAGKNKSRGLLATPRDYGHETWDDAIPTQEYFDEMRRVSLNQIIFGGNYFAEYLGNSSCWIVWDKDNGATDFADCELAWTSFDTAVRKFRFRWNGMLQEDMARKEVRQHPTQKPVELMRWCLNKYSNEGDTILDPFAGSGTTCVAAKILGRKYIGIEISPVYAEIARKRVEQAQYEEQLFTLSSRCDNPK
jgi:site-specific DNA-methyltransferase (adenine-specific)